MRYERNRNLNVSLLSALSWPCQNILKSIQFTRCDFFKAWAIVLGLV